MFDDMKNGTGAFANIAGMPYQQICRNNQEMLPAQQAT
jgi:hypothetical protein